MFQVGGHQEWGDLQRLRPHCEEVEEVARQHHQGLAPCRGRQDRARHQERVQEQEEGRVPRDHTRQARVQEKTRVQTEKEACSACQV